MINLNEFCYHMHHLENTNGMRDYLYSNIDMIFKDKINKLKSKTVAIYDQNDLNNFILEYPLFKVSNNNVPRLKYPEVGLWASNYSLFKKFIETDYKYLIVFEDDIEVYENIIDLLNKYIKALPSHWECFCLFQPDSPVGDKGYNHIPDLYKTNNRHIWYAHQTWSTGGLLLTRGAVKKLIKYVELDGINLAIDLLIFKTNSMNLPIPYGNGKILNTYSLARYEQRMSGLVNIDSQIQNGKTIDKY